ncbi:MAG: hypothetical protein IK077_10380 [Thermoguttaceae bacterium]|nr:hypothetical protein [Thermoguttaceae bacterium]
MKRLFLLLATLFFTSYVFAGNDPCDPNSYMGTDSERIAQALDSASKSGGLVRIPPRKPDELADRTYWLLDSAILLRANTTLILENCTLKLSDACRDNFIRSANCGIGIEKVEPIENVHIVGIGSVRLEGADRPRATGDSGKTLGERTYGTDAGKEGESQKGDWRNIGVLLANVSNFSVENISIINAHAWSMSLEKCSFGAVRNIRFESIEQRTIDGESVKTLNVDGLDLRKGCHNITIDGITGTTGDDLVACTAIGAGGKIGGVLESTEVSDFSPEDELDIHDVSIHNVIGYAAGGHQIVRLLNASGIKIYRVIIDGVIDTSPEGVVDRATIRIGDANPAWGGVTPLGDTYGIIVTNVQSQSRQAVLIAGSLVDSSITNVVNYHPDVTGVGFESGEENVKNVRIDPFINVGAER